jgi:predicted nicotinamide N-methyase
MTAPPEPIRTSDGSTHPLHEFHLNLAGREWTILHTGLFLSHSDEWDYLKDVREGRNKTPYGVTLWPSAIALAHEIAARGEADPGAFVGRTVLELGAGTGLPGIVAAAQTGVAWVVQTDREEMALTICKRNAERNGASSRIQHRAVDWTNWHDDGSTRYDWIIGSDILYAEPMHPHLQSIFAASLAPGGRVLLSDPFRAPSLRLFESLEAQGWAITLTKWNLGEDDKPRAVGVFELTPPG